MSKPPSPISASSAKAICRGPGFALKTLFGQIPEATRLIQQHFNNGLERLRYWEWRPSESLLDLQADWTLSKAQAGPENRQLKLNRQAAASLIEAVLDETMTPLQALVRWPIETQDSHDPSLQAAYQILWHFESDETSQKTEPFYLDTQLALLSRVAILLANAHALPDYILAAYSSEHRARFFFASSYFDDISRLIAAPVRGMMTLIRQVCRAG